MAAAGFKSAVLALLCAACTSIAADARTFERTRWHVTAINGRATPATTNGYRVEFMNGEISGNVGCNIFGGRYSVARDVLLARGLTSTLMACSGPGMDFEGEALAVLSKPMRMTWVSGQRLTLSNSLGSIGLERRR